MVEWLDEKSEQLFLVASLCFLRANKTVFRILKQDIKCCETSVTLRDIPLEFDLRAVLECTGVDLLLHHAEIIPERNDLFEKHLQIDLFCLKRWIFWL